MSLARATAGGGSALLRRLATGPDAERAASAAAVAIAVKHTMRPATPPCSRTSFFHTSAPRPARRRPRFSNVRAAAMGLVDEAAVSKFSEEHFPGYTAEEKTRLEKKYTPAQLAALEAGEAAVDPRDLTVQGRLRTDAEMLGFNYVDDFSQVKPVIDKRVKRKDSDAAVATDAKFMDDEVFADDLIRWLESFVPKDINLAGLTDEQLEALAKEHGPKDADMMDYWFNRPPLVRRDGKTPVPASATGDWALAPALGSYVPGVTELYRKQQDPEDGGADERGEYKDLKRRTGLQVEEMGRLTTKTLVFRWVSNQTRLGKVASASMAVIVGNGEGRLGLGIAKSAEAQTAKEKATAMAVRNMRPVARYENRTIYGNVEAKVSGTVVQLYARPPGFGLRVPHRIFEMARAVGISDLAARIPRSRNPLNTVKAAFQALTNQPDPEEIAIGRGKKLVDVRKVYYGGAVY